MHQNRITLIVWSMLFVLAGLGNPTHAQSVPPGQGDCPPGVISTTFDAPPAGKANFRTIRLDEDCRPVVGPVITVPLDQLPTIALSTQSRQTVLEPSTAGEQANARGTATYYAEQAVHDIVNITLNKVYSSISFTYNSTQIVSYSAGGGTLSHRENKPPSCGKGWKLKVQNNMQISGGVGLPWVGFLQSGEFKYKGLFDCSGTIYYNKLQNYPTVYANGTGSCRFTQEYRTWSLLWYWTMACY
ncbi:MAG: hypothetical protein IPM16_17625 [Chloroflexi bacterium]|nr:hypothetical protein [Chloroflexota bacterium]